MGNLNDFFFSFFSLSSEDRITILKNLYDKRMKLTQVSKKLNFTVTKVSGHLQRLSDTKLNHKRF